MSFPSKNGDFPWFSLNVYHFHPRQVWSMATLSIGGGGNGLVSWDMMARGSAKLTPFVVSVVLRIWVFYVEVKREEMTSQHVLALPSPGRSQQLLVGCPAGCWLYCLDRYRRYRQ